MNDVIPEITKRVEKLYKEYDRPQVDTKKELHKLLTWLLSGRSIVQHRCFWAFMMYLYEQVGQESEDLHNFKERLFVNMGLTTVIYKSKDTVYLQPESVKFAECSQKRFQEIFNKVKEFAAVKLDIMFDDWHQYYLQNENLV